MTPSEPASIIGIVLVRNEDIFVERAIRNTIDFCDFMVIADHYSTDGTFDIVAQLAAEYPEKIQLVRITDTPESHFLISGYANSPAWIFAVDGDEIYDPAGLALFRQELLDGVYDRWWLLFGNVLNCEEADPHTKRATGYLAPPCRSMTKLFNFRAIQSWEGAVTHVLANGTIMFNEGWDASLRLNLHEKWSWEESPYRCLHTCFMRRSSLDAAGATARPNVSENRRTGIMERLKRLRDRLLGRPPASAWKLEKYARGEKVTVDASAFFPNEEGAPR